LEILVSDLVSQNTLNDMQSGFRSGHSTAEASLKVIDDIKW